VVTGVQTCALPISLFRQGTPLFKIPESVCRMAQKLN
jgi:hypothetical protein